MGVRNRSLTELEQTIDFFWIPYGGGGRRPWQRPWRHKQGLVIRVLARVPPPSATGFKAGRGGEQVRRLTRFHTLTHPHTYKQPETRSDAGHVAAERDAAAAARRVRLRAALRWARRPGVDAGTLVRRSARTHYSSSDCSIVPLACGENNAGGG